MKGTKSDNRVGLTDAYCSAIQAPEDVPNVIVWDEKITGLGLRIGKRTKTWILNFRPEGSGRSTASQKISLGNYPSVNVAMARRAAKAHAGTIALGENPAEKRREEKRKERAKVNLVLDEYEERLIQRGYANVKTAMSTLRRGLGSHLNRDMAELTRTDFLKQIENWEKAGKSGAAQDLRKHLRTLCEWCANTDRIQLNPLAGLRRERATKAERIDKEQHGSALNDDELKRVWNAAKIDTVFGRYIRALFLTGCRRQEISRLTWDMIVDDRIIIPSTHTKQGRPHIVPISPELHDVINACPETTSNLVFPSPRSGGELKGWTQLVAAINKASAVQFQLHDARRTLRTGLTDLGISTELAEICIGHQTEDLIRTYDRSERWSERLDAFAKWGAHITALVNRK